MASASISHCVDTFRGRTLGSIHPLSPTSRHATRVRYLSELLDGSLLASRHWQSPVLASLQIGLRGRRMQVLRWPSRQQPSLEVLQWESTIELWLRVVNRDADMNRQERRFAHKWNWKIERGEKKLEKKWNDTPGGGYGTGREDEGEVERKITYSFHFQLSKICFFQCLQDI